MESKERHNSSGAENKDRTPFIIFTTLYLSIGLLNLFNGADPNSRFFYFDDLLIRFTGILFVISSIGLYLRKELARKGIIVALALSLIEILIGIPENIDVTEFIVGVIVLLMIYVPGLIYFIFHKNKV